MLERRQFQVDDLDGRVDEQLDFGRRLDVVIAEVATEAA